MGNAGAFIPEQNGAAGFTSAATAGISSIAGGTSTATGALVSFANSNNVSFGISGNTITASVLPDTGIGLSAGTQSMATGIVVFANGGGVSFGLNASTLTASIAAGATATGNLGAISAAGSSISAGTVVFANSNNVSFGMNGSTITATVTTPAQTPFAVSAGSQSVSTGTLVFANSNGVTFGMSGSSQITASIAAAGGTLSYWGNGRDYGTTANGTLAAVYQRASFASHMSATELDIFILLTNSQQTATVNAAMYTMSGSTASRVSSFSGTFTTPSAAGGLRVHQVSIGTWAITPGDYMLLFQIWESFGAHPRYAIQQSSALGTAATNYWGDGIYSATGSAIPASVHLSDLNHLPAVAYNAAVRLIGTF